MPATGRWTGSTTSATTSNAGCSGRSRTCSTSRSICCSSTPPPPTSSWRTPTNPWPATNTATPCPTTPPPQDDGKTTARTTARTTAGRRRNRVGFRTYGKSKDSRNDLPQIVIGMAVTRDGIPVRVWCWPGNTNDSALIRQVKDDMRDWTLSKIVWVADRGFSSAAQPPLPAPGRSRLHHRREAALRLPGDQGRPVAAGPLHRHRGQPAGQGGEGVRHRAVRDLPQPRRRRARRAHPRAAWSPNSRS